MSAYMPSGADRPRAQSRQVRVLARPQLLVAAVIAAAIILVPFLAFAQNLACFRYDAAGNLAQIANCTSDVNNCGAIGNMCATGNACCTGHCSALASDPSNCGACGNVCP